MSTHVSPSRLPPPSSEQRTFTEERYIGRMEVYRTHLVSHIGFWSALLTAVLGMAWALASFASNILGLLPQPWGLVAQMVPSLFLAPAFVVLLVCVQHRTPVERRIWSSIAVPLGAIYATLCSTVYFVELTLVIPHQLSGDIGNLGVLVFGFGTFLYAVNVFGYGFMSLAGAFAAPAFGGSRLENWICWLLLANWPLAFVGPLVMMFWPQFAFLWVVWVFTIPLPAILLAVLFQRRFLVTLYIGL
jgi:hypothetical protein